MAVTTALADSLSVCSRILSASSDHFTVSGSLDITACCCGDSLRAEGGGIEQSVRRSSGKTIAARAARERRRQRGRFFAPIARHADGERILWVRGGVCGLRRVQAKAARVQAGWSTSKTHPTGFSVHEAGFWSSTRSRSARLLMQNLRKRMARPGLDGCAGACRGLWRLCVSVELCRTDASARGGEETCTSLLGPQAAGINGVQAWRRGQLELLMRFGAESQPLLSRAAAASTSTSAIGAASFS